MYYFIKMSIFSQENLKTGTFMQSMVGSGSGSGTVGENVWIQQKGLDREPCCLVLYGAYLCTQCICI
jgi:hypothetical protein